MNREEIIQGLKAGKNLICKNTASAEVFYYAIGDSLYITEVGGECMRVGWNWIGETMDNVYFKT